MVASLCSIYLSSTFSWIEIIMKPLMTTFLLIYSCKINFGSTHGWWSFISRITRAFLSNPLRAQRAFCVARARAARSLLWGKVPTCCPLVPPALLQVNCELTLRRWCDTITNITWVPRKLHVVGTKARRLLYHYFIIHLVESTRIKSRFYTVTHQPTPIGRATRTSDGVCCSDLPGYM